jgi:SAM-dependent methyltransferase
MADSTPSTDTDRDFYEKFYRAVASSQANAEYCLRLFGQNMEQDGFAEIPHLNHLIEVTGIGPGDQVLDLGCGSGMISEYISDQTGASVTGTDYVPFAIQKAKARTAAKSDRLHFEVMEIAKLDFQTESFDVVVSIDTLYFAPLAESLPRILKVLKPGGRMGAFFNQSWQPWTPIENFDKSATHPDRTELAVALQKLNLQYTYWDYTAKDLDHARRKEALAEELRPRFEEEGVSFLYDSHIGSAKGIQQAIAAGAHARFLYLVQKHQ